MDRAWETLERRELRLLSVQASFEQLTGNFDKINQVQFSTSLDDGGLGLNRRTAQAKRASKFHQDRNNQIQLKGEIVQQGILDEARFHEFR